MNTFRTLYGKPVENIISYITEYINERSDIEILIGTDSQSYSNVETVFGVAIALYTPGKGAHVLCTREVVPIERILSTRLLKEVWKSIEIAEYLKDNGLPKPKWIDIDLNPDPRYKSNSVLRQAVGMVEGMGYKVRYKQLGAMSTYAANHLVRI
jgi:predicted RNase H-related nuclease YkuK (DUF458 family)